MREKNFLKIDIISVTFTINLHYSLFYYLKYTKLISFYLYYRVNKLKIASDICFLGAIQYTMYSKWENSHLVCSSIKVILKSF